MDVLTLHNPPEVIAARFSAIHSAILKESPRITAPNFERVGQEDVARLFGLYDNHFFDGWLGRTVKEKADGPLTFRLSSAMTRAGGKTTRIRVGPRGGQRQTFFDIAIASRLLFMTFSDIQRPVVIGGLECGDRLTAMQRIMEHEIVHLAELLVWEKSSCSAGRFKTLARNIFGHLGTKHALVTPGERAAIQHGIRVGSHVAFEFDGRRYAGIVNRITHRATVLVESPSGQRYSNGKRYQKFYVPLGLLRVLQSAI